MTDLNDVWSAYGAQFGEIIWHSLHPSDEDGHISHAAAAHADVMRELINRHSLKPSHRRLRVLEVAAYVHYSVQIIASKMDADGAVHEVSPVSLRVGDKIAKEKGYRADCRLIAGDFHDLPFSTGYFDLVFIASAVHHTFRPWLLLDEMFRVLRPGGVLHLENEPVGRRFGFYQFRGNRQEQRTEFEAEIDRLGLTNTLTTPFGGQRPEALFGMIENDRIPLSIYMDAFERNGRVLDLVLRQVEAMGDFERLILALPRDQHLPQRIHDALQERFAHAAEKLTENDRLLGFSLPSRDQLWVFCYRMTDHLRALSDDDAHALTNMFGAALRATIMRGGSQPESNTMFRRELAQLDGVLVDDAMMRTARVDFNDDIKVDFPAHDWSVFDGPTTRELHNRTSDMAISVSRIARPAIMFARFYAVAQSRPYKIVFDTPVPDEHVICQSESRLARFMLAPGTERVGIRLHDLDGTPIPESAGLVRIAIARAFHVSSSG